MRLERLPYTPGAALEFYEAGLGTLGALCERTWHDRLQIVAEGLAARLWNPEGRLHDVELTFSPADTTAARDALHQVFPGSPLTFQLAEALRSRPLLLERVAVTAAHHNTTPEAGVAEKLWCAQFPDTARWRLVSPFKPAWHFSVLAVVRCEIQAIDQHWSLHRLAVSLSTGDPDDNLVRAIDFAEPDPQAAVCWPRTDPAQWQRWLSVALELDLAADLRSIRVRQEDYLRRELERTDDYFEKYERELLARAARSHAPTAKIKSSDRLAAAKAEHARRRADQVSRHEIRILPHWDALLLVAEPAWRAGLSLERNRISQSQEALFVPRTRRWVAAVP